MVAVEEGFMLGEAEGVDMVGTADAMVVEMVVVMVMGMVEVGELAGEVEAADTEEALSVIIVAEWVIWRETVTRVLVVGLGDAVAVVAAEVEEEEEGVFTAGRKGILRGNAPILRNENVGYSLLLNCESVY